MWTRLSVGPCSHAEPYKVVIPYDHNVAISAIFTHVGPVSHPSHVIVFFSLTFSPISSSIAYLLEYGPAPFPGRRS